MTTLYLVRHGETEDNVSQILQGQTNGELTQKGIEQAKELCNKLRNDHFDVLLSSDLKRAVDTATILNEPHHLKLEQTILLRERDWGDFTGRFIPDIQNETFPKNVEQIDKMFARARNFLTYINVEYKNKNILAVGHGLFNRCIQAVYYKKTIREISQMVNAEVRILEL
jgi:broad specificity phosphatase PhoE